MNRISKYRQSIDKFINDKIDFHDIYFKQFIISELSKSNFYISISILTITNKLCYIFNCSQHGYFFAVSTELLFFLKHMVEQDSLYKRLLENKYVTYIGNLISIIYKLIFQNIHLLSKPNATLKTVHITYLNIINLVYMLINRILIKDNTSYETHKKQTTIPHLDVIQIEVLNNIEKIKKDDLKDYVFFNYGMILSNILEIICLSFDDKDHLEIMKQIGIDLSLVLRLNIDLCYLNHDIDHIVQYNVDYSNNFIIHTDIFQTFETYMEVKQKVIENLLKCSFLTETFKDMFEMFDKSFDSLLEETNPEMSVAFLV
jgi:hypothetical protein